MLTCSSSQIYSLMAQVSPLMMKANRAHATYSFIRLVILVYCCIIPSLLHLTHSAQLNTFTGTGQHANANANASSSSSSSSSSLLPLLQLQSLALDELALLPQKQDQEKQQHSGSSSSSSSFSSTLHTEKDSPALQFNFFDIPTEHTGIIKRKMSMLSEVYDAVTELFEKAIGRRRDGLVGEAFGQLRMRCIEKIFNLKFLLQVVDRLVTERTHLERMSTLFESMAKKRTNETEFMVNQVHRTAAELSESIRGDLARVVDPVDGGIISSLFSSPLLPGSSSSLLSSGPLLSILGKMDGLRKFTVK